MQNLKLEDKPNSTHSDSVMIQGHTKKLHSLDADFKKHHFTIVDPINEDQEMLEREQVVLDDDGLFDPNWPYKARNGGRKSTQNHNRTLQALTYI